MGQIPVKPQWKVTQIRKSSTGNNGVNEFVSLHAYKFFVTRSSL